MYNKYSRLTEIHRQHSSFLSSGVASLVFLAHVFILELCSGSPASLVSQSLRIVAALLIFCKS
jgi:hypothetical protein